MLMEDITDVEQQLEQPLLANTEIKRRGGGGGGEGARSRRTAGDDGDQKDPSASSGGSGSGSDMEPMEMVDSGSGDNDKASKLSTAEIRLALILSQWAWPAFLLSVVSPYDTMVPFLLCNSIMLFLLRQAVIKDGGSLKTADYLPTVVWIVVLFLPEFFVLYAAFGAFLGICIVLVRCKNRGVCNTCTWLFTCSANCVLPEQMDLFKRMEEQYVDQLRETEEAEDAKAQAQHDKLKHLDDATVEKPPVWILLVILLLSVWSLFVVGWCLRAVNSIEMASVTVKPTTFLPPSV